MKFTFSAAALLALLPSLASASNHFVGVVVANAKGNNGAYTCRTAADWDAVAANLKTYGFGTIRILGFDCNALTLASQAAANHGLTVMAGIYASSGTIGASITQINNDVQSFVAAVRQFGAGRYTRLAIGNEVQDSAINIMNKVWDVRGYLQSIGINVPVGTVHTWVMVRDNPILCNADFIGANAHAYYDYNTAAGNAGNWLTNTVLPAVKRSCSAYAYNLLITESGWPTRGGTLGAAVPTLGNANAADKALNCAAQNVKVYAFEYDDQLWKGNDAERSFGMFGKGLTVSDVISSC